MTYAWLPVQSEVISREVATTEESLKSSTKEVKEVKIQLQALEIELQSQLSMVRTPRWLMLHLLVFASCFPYDLSGFRKWLTVSNCDCGRLFVQKASLEGTLADIKNRYAMQLNGYQMQVRTSCAR